MPDVLIVDDNQDAADLLADLLRFIGYPVRVARDANQGLSMAAEQLPDLALVDIGLPGINGWELGRRLRERYGTALHLAAVTGYGHADDRRRSNEAGFDHHLVKPVDLQQLEAILGDISPAPRDRPTGSG